MAHFTANAKFNYSKPIPFWMKDGSKITVSSWEDAGGEMTYVKGEAND